MCNDVEPHLHPLDDETFPKKTANVQDGACLDIVMNGFWGGHHERQTSECLTFLTVELPSMHATGKTNLLRSELISQEFGKWCTVLSLL